MKRFEKQSNTEIRINVLALDTQIDVQNETDLSAKKNNSITFSDHFEKQATGNYTSQNEIYQNLWVMRYVMHFML
ncbi:hypothetical protein TNCT_473511 [Trichonephila clavata]|uniref:Uncharacterized protein n=1 Tax=Trichonephila clavata TaxID=2740835 RepID=A0A8X6GG26_TRICU|nr:hypothetical protein TNCT_473511 [Trichonephila clavata]